MKREVKSNTSNQRKPISTPSIKTYIIHSISTNYSLSSLNHKNKSTPSKACVCKDDSTIQESLYQSLFSNISIPLYVYNNQRREIQSLNPAKGYLYAHAAPKGVDTVLVSTWGFTTNKTSHPRMPVPTQPNTSTPYLE